MKKNIKKFYQQTRKENKQENRTIKVQNAIGEEETRAEVLVQNKIDYTPKISVVMPVYNVEKFLRECLDSVTAQSLKEIEIICVDDGSTDNSLEILREYARKDKRITLLKQKNAGSGKARNNAIDNAKGEFIAFMDSDDMYPNEKTLEHLYNKAIENNVIICGGSLSQLREGGIIVTDPKEFEEGYSFKKEGIVNYSDYQFDYGYWRFIYNRQFLKENQLYFPDYLRQQDPPFFVKTMAIAEKFYAIREATYVYRVSHKQIQWTERKSVDTVRGLTDCLNYTTKYNLPKLHYSLAQRLCNPWFLRAFKLLEDKIELHKYLVNMVNALNFDVIYSINSDFKLPWFYKSLPQLFKISVVIPVYNVEQYLRQCMDSVIRQTYQNLDIICVNDGATDDSLKILEEYEKKDERVKIITQKNQGLSAARNTGIKNCRSALIYFIDSDDYIEENTIEILYKNMIYDNSDVSIGKTCCVGDEKKIQSVQAWINRWHKVGKFEIGQNIRSEIFPTAWNKLYKMSIIKKFNIRFPEGLINEDEYWLWAYMVQCQTYSVTDKAMYFYLQRKNSIMSERNSSRKILDIVNIYCKVYETLEKYRKINVYKEALDATFVMSMRDLINRCPLQMYDACNKEILKYVKLSSSSKISAFYSDIQKELNVQIINQRTIDLHPRISVIIPVYNTQTYLGDCLDSLINQTLKEIEIICIDDESTDNSFDVLKEYAQKDKRISIIRQSNQRQGVARNNGIKYAKGEYIFFCDSDDYLDNECLEKLYNKIVSEGSDICLYGCATYNNQTKQMFIDKFRDLSSYKLQIDKVCTYRDIKNALFSHFYPFCKLYRRQFILENDITIYSLRQKYISKMSFLA